MELYTVILEFKGDLSVHQVIATNEKEALVEWVKTFDYERLYLIPCKWENRSQFVKSCDIYNQYMEIPENTQNVWVTSGFIHSSLVLFHIITTKENENKNFIQ